ncbi:adenylate cyclase associated N terminal-domain-containing protein [Tirmania nivea]|nr:adenylate cyclase associated N terminal-domain-containing protein [Tirmania nivea]
MAANPQMYNLTTLIKRLEAATSRLEDLASIPSGAGASIAASVPASATAGSTTSFQAAAPTIVQDPPVLQDFDALISNEVKKYNELSNEIGSIVEEQSKIVERCFTEQRKFLLITTKAKKPTASSNLLLELNTGMQKEVTAVSEMRENQVKGSPYYDHLSAVSEGILALVWVGSPEPTEHVKGMLESAQYWGNRVMSEYKNKDKKHVEWIQSFFAILKSLQAYVKKHHPHGVTWNEKDGVDAKDALASLPAAPAAGAAAGAAAPPPPPPPPPPTTTPPTRAPTTTRRWQYYPCSSVTSRLKKVDKSQMTHKNPELRASSLVPDKVAVRGKSPAPPPVRKPAHMKTKKPPKMELDGNKWLVENYENDHNIIIPDVEIHHSIFIYHCKNVVIQVKGKCNAITISECAKTSLVAESLVSSIDVIKSTGFAVQVIHKIPTILVDGCDGGVAYISNESFDVEIFTTKTTGLNVFVAEAGEEGDYAERSVPEQLKHTIKNGQLVSEIVEHAG